MPKERALYLHESKGGLYGTALFYMTRTMGEVPGQTIFGWLCAAITYEMYGFRDDTGARLTYYAIIVLSTLAGASVLTCVGAMCKDMDQSNAAISIISKKLKGAFSIVYSSAGAISVFSECLFHTRAREKRSPRHWRAESHKFNYP